MDPVAFSTSEVPSSLIARLFPRRITREQVRSVLTDPQNIGVGKDGLWVLQAKLPRPDKPDHWGPYLLRVFVDVTRKSPVVLTAYWTSRVKKFGSSCK